MNRLSHLGLFCAAVLVVALPAGVNAELPARARIPILLDTDIGDDVDDAFALALALRSPELDLRGITTAYGDAHTRALLVCRLLDAVGRPDIPVASGSRAREKPDSRGQLEYGLRPLGRSRPLKAPAVDFLYRQLRNRPGELTLVAVGPLGNIAELFTKHPDCKPWIKQLVLMAGSVRVGYNNKPPPQAEWNVKADVKAAQVVFSSGVPLLIAPLDATTSLKLDEPLRRRIFTSGTPLGKELDALYQLWKAKTPTLYDPMAVALCCNESFCKIEELRLEVDNKGFTRIVQGRPNARVATSVRAAEFLRWYVERIAPTPAENK